MVITSFPSITLNGPLTIAGGTAMGRNKFISEPLEYLL